MKKKKNEGLLQLILSWTVKIGMQDGNSKKLWRTWTLWSLGEVWDTGDFLSRPKTLPLTVMDNYVIVNIAWANLNQCLSLQWTIMWMWTWLTWCSHYLTSLRKHHPLYLTTLQCQMSLKLRYYTRCKMLSFTRKLFSGDAHSSTLLQNSQWLKTYLAWALRQCWQCSYAV